MKKCVIISLILLLTVLPARAAYLLIPMDEVQKNHLKAYGVAYYALQRDVEVTWLLNYRGGSFMMKYADLLDKECRLRGVTAEVIADGQSSAILSEIADPSVNMDAVKLQKAPKIAVYSPKNKLPWDDAVTLVLTYADIPYDVVYDEEVIAGVLPMYAAPAPRRLHRPIWQVLGQLPQPAMVYRGCTRPGSHGDQTGICQGEPAETGRGTKDSRFCHGRRIPLCHVLGT